MSPRTGLGPLELSLLDALDLLAGSRAGDPVRCAEVLAAVERLHGFGPRYSWPALVDLGAPWRLHLPLVELMGNVGSQHGDPPADSAYVEGRLSEIGVLALAAERDEVGPLPLGLIEGSLYRDGVVPPFAPAAVVSALLAGRTDAGIPVLPTGGTVEGDVAGLLAGRPARLTLGCTIRDEIERIVITEVPLGVRSDELVERITQALHTVERGDGTRPRRIRRPDAGSAVSDVRDDSSARDGLRIVLDVERRTNVPRVIEWLREIWPVSIDVDCRLPAPMSIRLESWDRGDGSGLRALADLLTPRF